MTRSELEHLIRASGDISKDSEIVIVGSQSILGQFPDAPISLRMSAGADVFPLHHPERADLIDGNIGEGSSFHELHGYYAQGVGERTAVLPKGWQQRVIPIRNPNTSGVTGLCLEVHDLAISKHVTGSEKDLAFTRELAYQGMTERKTLLARLALTAIEGPLRKLITERIRRDARG